MKIPGFRERFLSSMSGERIRAVAEDPRAVAVVPTGAIEQHGPHLPVGVDSMLGQVWLNLALENLEDEAPVYVAPPITFGKSNEHIGFPGTVSISRTSLRHLLRLIILQLADWGFRKAAILNTHGGNTSVLRYTLREMELERPDLHLGFLSFRNSVKGLSEQEATFGFHANLVETSLMLAVTPGHCRMEHAICHYPARVEDPGLLRPECAPATYSWVTADLSATGIMGDAASATVEQGLRWLESGARGLSEDLREWISR